MNKICEGHLVLKSWDFYNQNIHGQCQSPTQVLLPRRIRCVQEVYWDLHTHWHSFRHSICMAAFLAFRITICCIECYECYFRPPPFESRWVSFPFSLCIRPSQLLAISSVSIGQLLYLKRRRIFFKKEKKMMLLVQYALWLRQITTSNYNKVGTVMRLNRWLWRTEQTPSPSFHALVGTLLGECQGRCLGRSTEPLGD